MTRASSSPGGIAAAADDGALAAMTTAATSTPPTGVDAYQQQQLHAQSPMRRFSVNKGKTGRQSSKFGTVNYSIDEMRRLNEKVRAVMPVAGEDWLHVAYQFNYMRPESIPYREVESLKRKFKKMYCSRASSVSGRLPEYIDEAKELRRLINLRAEKAQLEASDTHSDADAQDMATGLTEQQQQQQSAKAETFVPPPALLNASHVSADGRSGALIPNGQQVHPHAGESEAIAVSAAANASAGGGGVDTLAAVQRGAVTNELPQENSSALTQQSQETPAAVAEQFASEAEVSDSRVIAAKLSEMEEEYRRAMGTRHPSQNSVDSLATTASSLVAPVNGHQQPPLQQEQQQITDITTGNSASPTTEGSPDSTSGIISMLKHSIERKRRTMEEQMLSESERVRKERKKRKMEQVLYSIHQEQRERELLSTNLEATTASILGVPQASASSGVPSAAGATSLALPGASLPLLPAAQLTTELSVGMMEIVLQYMVAQQVETARRLQTEQEQREREKLAKEQRRRERERLRRQERREFMLVMAAALEDKFPASLKHHLDEDADEFVGESEGIHGDRNDVAADAAPAAAVAAAPGNDDDARHTSSTSTEEAAEHFETDENEPHAVELPQQGELASGNVPTLI